MAEYVEAQRVSKDFLSLLEEHRKIILKNVLEHIGYKDNKLYEAATHLIKAGGKMIRPALVVLACKAVGGNEDLALFACVGAETGHVASLIHDDIIDEDIIRRNVLTTHVKYGIPIAILAGDLLIIKSFQMIERLVNEKNFPPELAIKLLKITCEGTLDITEGEYLDIEFLNKDDVKLDEYLRMIELKTARAFEIAMKGGAILGFAKDEEIEMLGNYGKYLGIAFQIEDDLISSLGEEKVTGKSVSDILKKRKTFMVCYVNTFGKPEYKERLKEILNKKEIDEKDILEIKKIFKETGAIEASKKFINYYTNKAVESIKNLKDSNAKTFLIELAYYLANRNK